MTDAVPTTNGDGGVRTAVEWVVIIVIAVVFALVIRAFVLQTFWIPSESMTPRLETNDRVLVNQLAYDIGDPERGDVVVFKTPAAAHLKLEHLVKRVVGLPGETIEGHDGRILINGSVLAEPYLEPGEPSKTFSATQIPPDAYFMLGDNRQISDDSSTWGPANRDLFVGPVFMTIWPLGRLDVPGWLWGVPVVIGLAALGFSRLRRRKPSPRVGGCEE